MKRLWVGMAAVAALGVSQSVTAQDIEAKAAEKEALEMRLAELKAAEAELQRAAEQVARLSVGGGDAARALASDRRVIIKELHRQLGIGKPVLGVSLSDSNDSDAGVLIARVVKGSAAENGGLKDGDILTKVADVKLAGLNVMPAAELIGDVLVDKSAGDEVTVGVQRDGKALVKTLVLQEPKDLPMVEVLEMSGAPGDMETFVFETDGTEGFVFAEPGRAAQPLFAGRGRGNANLMFRFGHSPWGSMELVELSEGLGKYFGTETGLLVVRAPEDESIGFEDGDVIKTIGGRTPEDVGHALRILDSYASGEALKVKIMRDKRGKTLDVTLPE
ncbi:MAG: PDZ domain-containing protein [Pseudomonadota bacterium]